jgi:3-methyladenine DNA glycosylase/8-oxoguanine DNA glycosylase
MSKHAIAHLSSDPVMSALIEKIGIIHLRPRRLPPFQSLAHAIIHQQLNSNAAGTILERFKGLFPDDDFPTPGQVAKASVDRLRTAGLSRPKAAYIIELAKRCNASLIPGVNDCDSCHENPRPVRTGCRKVIINLAEPPPTEAGLQGRPRI